MCYFKDIDHVNSINQIQTIIVRIISKQKEAFNYGDIIGKIKKELHALGVKSCIVDSYRIDNMINDTLEQMVNIGSISYINNLYFPCRVLPKKVRYAFV